MRGGSAVTVWQARMVDVLCNYAVVPIFCVYAAYAVRFVAVRSPQIFVRLSGICAAAFISTLCIDVFVQRSLGSSPSVHPLIVPALRGYVQSGIYLSVFFAVTPWFRRFALVTAAATAIAWLAAAAPYAIPAIRAQLPSMSRSMVFLLTFIIPAVCWHSICGIGLCRAARKMAGASGSARLCCSACGYPLTGLTSPDRCPECGATFAKAT